MESTIIDTIERKYKESTIIALVHKCIVRNKLPQTSDILSKVSSYYRQIEDFPELASFILYEVNDSRN